mmetsp:Transcript_62055/g.196216  ORF Transcript_62055/g.196216 Transcript_62055/m.196216 type:complete len:176 (-) Transcript_62055:308-835(-)
MVPRAWGATSAPSRAGIGRLAPAAPAAYGAGYGGGRGAGNGAGTYGDPELRDVLELASDDELEELAEILFGSSAFSPVVKSLSSGDEVVRANVAEIKEGGAGREAVRRRLEERFLFLAADSVSTLRGRLPTYRQALLSVVRKLKIECPPSLSTRDVEMEIFLYTLEKYSSEEPSR